MGRIIATYFSPTGTTRTVVETLGKELSYRTGEAVINKPFTTPKERTVQQEFRKEDRVVFGVPVYAGRVPNILLKYLGTLQGNGVKTTAIVLYGNRNFDDALIELRDILWTQGFNVTSAAAFIGEHSFSYTLAKNRPDQLDLRKLELLAEDILKYEEKPQRGPVEVPGTYSYRPYYRPKNPQGEFVDIRKVQPRTSASCDKCGRCTLLCPVGSIDKEFPAKITGICIKCGACVKCCPHEAKYFIDPDYIRHKVELEEGLTERKKPQWFVN